MTLRETVSQADIQELRDGLSRCIGGGVVIAMNAEGAASSTAYNNAIPAATPPRGQAPSNRGAFMQELTAEDRAVCHALDITPAEFLKAKQEYTSDAAETATAANQAMVVDHATGLTQSEQEACRLLGISVDDYHSAKD